MALQKNPHQAKSDHIFDMKTKTLQQDTSFNKASILTETITFLQNNNNIWKPDKFIKCGYIRTCKRKQLVDSCEQ